MTKKILLSAIAILTMSIGLNAQVIEDFETWNPYSIVGSATTVQMSEPAGWSSSDSFVVGVGLMLNPSGTFQPQIFEENPGYNGSKSLRVVSKAQAAIAAVGMPAKDYPCIATNSLISIDAINNTYNQLGGTPVTYDPNSTSMYVKNLLVGGDSTFILVEVIDNSDGGDSIMAVADTVLTTSITSYTQITLPFTYTATPGLSATIVRYTISSGNPLALLDSTSQYSVHDGTEIDVDDISIATPTGVKQLINADPIAKVYPTYNADEVFIDLFELKSNEVFELYNTAGQLVITKNLKYRSNRISLNDIASGEYIYSLKKDGIIHQTGKLVR